MANRTVYMSIIISLASPWLWKIASFTHDSLGHRAVTTLLQCTLFWQLLLSSSHFIQVAFNPTSNSMLLAESTSVHHNSPDCQLWACLVVLDTGFQRVWLIRRPIITSDSISLNPPSLLLKIISRPSDILLRPWLMNVWNYFVLVFSTNRTVYIHLTTWLIPHDS